MHDDSIREPDVREGGDPSDDRDWRRWQACCDAAESNPVLRAMINRGQPVNLETYVGLAWGYDIHDVEQVIKRWRRIPAPLRPEWEPED